MCIHIQSMLSSYMLVVIIRQMILSMVAHFGFEELVVAVGVLIFVLALVLVYDILIVFFVALSYRDSAIEAGVDFCFHITR